MAHVTKSEISFYLKWTGKFATRQFKLAYFLHISR